VFFSLGSTLTVLSIGAYCPYPPNFCGTSHSNNNKGFLSDKVSILKVGGYFGIVTAGIAYYCGLSELLTPNDIITLPMGTHDA
jgi:succinate-acetate transporter protein